MFYENMDLISLKILVLAVLNFQLKYCNIYIYITKIWLFGNSKDLEMF